MGRPLYHYTDRTGKEAIEASGAIMMSTTTLWGDDAAYGNGVYFTGIGPNNRSNVIIGNNWDGGVLPDYMKYRVEWYFEFNTDELNGVFQVKEAMDYNRDIWLFPYNNVVCYQQARRRRI